MEIILSQENTVVMLKINSVETNVYFFKINVKSRLVILLWTHLQQCQNYDNLLDCVTSENEGCKQRPQSCEVYVGQIDYYSIVQEDCIWYNNKCVQRECQYAPDYYGQVDCRQYGNFIGKLIGGCQDSPDNFNQILEEQFCEFNYSKEKCNWLDGKCTLFECIKLKLPTYKNHQICQKFSPLCTFHLEVLGCVDNICENITEIEYCSVDSKGTICAINQEFIDKKCKTAPISYDSNQKCEQWLPYCTVNLQRLQNSNITVRCVDKQNKCEVALKEQCYSTISGINCKWDSINQKCIYKVCIDADPNLYLTNEDCNSFDVLQGACIIKSSGFGCEQWPNNCEELISEFQCKLNLQDETKCFWTGSLCKTLECSDASKINYTNNIECNIWLDY
ncbi:unnamed protein product [Paramecium pentaurelia]|uniref:Uncharacterized protein n=1 Tax=Paramecium pentaurelia TaxID=43138 RepID=A0A8S1T575_9CILI|nr:unnamed protein product [Paramecium pentaurelia]